MKLIVVKQVETKVLAVHILQCSEYMNQINIMFFIFIFIACIKLNLRFLNFFKEMKFKTLILKKSKSARLIAIVNQLFNI